MPNIYVKDSAELSIALANAKGGETIFLAAGDYSSLKIVNKQYNSTVTITSADKDHFAHVSDFTISGTSNVKLSALDVGRALTSLEADWTYINIVESSSNVTLDNMSIHGSLNNTPSDDGVLMLVRGTAGFVLSNSEFQQGKVGMMTLNSSNIQISNNSFHDMRVDAMDFASVQNVLVNNNKFDRFFARDSGDHPDAIQFWTSGTSAASSNIVIRDNIIMQTAGTASQGIFIQDELGTLPYSNVEIYNNLFYSTGYWHGISLNHVNGGSIYGNTVLSETTDNVNNRIMVQKSSNILVTDNVTDQIWTADNDGLILRNNIDLSKDPVKASLFPMLNAGGFAHIDGLVTPGIGYQSTEGRVATVLADRLKSMLGIISSGEHKELSLDKAGFSTDQEVVGPERGLLANSLASHQSGAASANSGSAEQASKMRLIVGKADMSTSKRRLFSTCA